MTERARDFLAANANYGVVSKRHTAADGVVYTLANGRTFALTAVEANDVGFPRWERN
jgi:hypothetical protein